MKTLKKILASLFLITGLSILLLGAIDLKNPNNTKQYKEGGLAAIILFSLPSTAIKKWLIGNLRQQY